MYVVYFNFCAFGCAFSFADEGPRAYHGTSTLDHIIYIVGGFDGVEYFNSVRSFNPMTKEWKEKAPMNAKR